MRDTAKGFLRALCSLLLLSLGFHPTHSGLLPAHSTDSTHSRKVEALQEPQTIGRRPGKLLIRNSLEVPALLESSSSGQHLSSPAALAKLGLKKHKSVGSQGWMLVDVADGQDNAVKMKQLQSQGYSVEYDWVVRASRTPRDRSWRKVARAMTRISAPGAWDTFTGNGDVTVCVIDSGINLSHPDLKANVLPTSYDARRSKESPTAGADDYGHGSHCAGTIGAVGNNGVGVAGIMWNAKLLSCKFLNHRGVGFISDAIECIRWCRTKKAKITSNSWEGWGYSNSLRSEIQSTQDAGGLFIVAAGNQRRNVDVNPAYPPSFHLSSIISVGATNPTTDHRASFSNFGASKVDLFAPGVNIYSTVLGSSYGTSSGTSMACPHVAGAAALVWSYRPSLTAAQVKSVILRSVDPVRALSGLCVSGGRLNVSRALQFAAAL